MKDEEHETIMDPYGPAAFPVVPKVPDSGRDRVCMHNEYFYPFGEGEWIELPVDLSCLHGQIYLMAADSDYGSIIDEDFSGPIGDLEGLSCSGATRLEELDAIERLAASCTRDERLAVAAYMASRGGRLGLLDWANALEQADEIADCVIPLIDDRIKFYSEARRVGLSVAEPSRMGDKELEKFFSRAAYGLWQANLHEVALHPSGFYDRDLGGVDKGLYDVPELVEIGREAARGRLSREEAYTGVKGALLREAKLAVEELASQPWVSEEMRAGLGRLAAGDEGAWGPWLVVACADIVSSLDDKADDALFAWAQHEMNPSRDCSWVAEVANAAAQHDEIPFRRFSEEHGKVYGVVQARPETRYADWCLDPECGGYLLTRSALEHSFDYESYGEVLLAEEGKVSGDFYVPDGIPVDLELFSWEEIDRISRGPALSEEEAHSPYPLSSQRAASEAACRRDDAVRDVAAVSLGDHEV